MVRRGTNKGYGKQSKHKHERCHFQFFIFFLNQGTGSDRFTTGFEPVFRFLHWFTTRTVFPADRTVHGPDSRLNRSGRPVRSFSKPCSYQHNCIQFSRNEKRTHELQRIACRLMILQTQIAGLQCDHAQNQHKSI